MTKLAAVFLLSLIDIQFGLSLQACAECECCYNGSNFCDKYHNCIVGCEAGYYGAKCTDQCLDNCKTCVNGYECTECRPGYYTNKCNLPCGKGCLNNTCSLLLGECPCMSADFVEGRCDACLGHKYGDECDKTCPINCGSCISETECSWCNNTAFFGSYCQYRCSVDCVDGPCDRYTGYCFPVCKPGFVGEFCNNTCKDGTYGDSCSKSCNEIDQHCQACNTNESGSYGNCTKCERGYYPAIPYEYALLICVSCPFNCKDKVCDATGLCYNGCVQGKWGRNCNTDCKTNCVECDQNNGTCLECSTDTFTYNCSLNCSTNCNNTSNGRICAMDTGRCLQSNESKRVCDVENGTCLYGCKAGFRGKRCNSMCDSRCLNTICNQINGNCLHGCIQGFKGPKCVEAIQTGQEGNTTGTLIGSIAGSLVAGGTIVAVAALIAFIVWRRRHGYSKQAGLHGYEKTSRNGEYVPNDNAHESDSPATYEDLKSRDERLYSQITTSQQISPPATD